MNLKEEKKLVEKAQYSLNAFGKLYDYYYDKIYHYALRRTGDVAMALDITANVFLKALKHRATFQWRDFPFSSWLYKIASNEIHDYFASKQRKILSLETLMSQSGFEPAANLRLEEEMISAEAELQRSQQFRQVQELLHTLSPEAQTIIILKFFERKKITEIAYIVGKKEGTVKSILSRSIGRIRKQLQESSAPNQGAQPLVNDPVIVVEGTSYE